MDLVEIIKHDILLPLGCCKNNLSGSWTDHKLGRIMNGCGPNFRISSKKKAKWKELGDYRLLNSVSDRVRNEYLEDLASKFEAELEDMDYFFVWQEE
ncbi:hypothetical protein MKW98_031956 [Papaver atlanticum]|uniref:Uncharacterized protein n=1 Tax=Papaver atlanticum TaxID=357466 RepID=A0AAD4XEB7_9MAGN|nr:hypothetical protein MKW98_031956 [Papaver atlanticum]